MTVIRIDNYSYFSSILGIVISLVFITVGILDKNILILLLGISSLLICLYFLRKYQQYKITLTKGKITEFDNNKKKEFLFNDISKFDCEVVKGFETISIYPILNLINDDHKEFILKLKDHTSLLDIVKWIKSNYPSTIITKNVEDFINKPKADWFFSNKKF